tara:strand:- start:13 stop:882 length:870 start_codon:yes stop_codon:yes gene_type:complete
MGTFLDTKEYAMLYSRLTNLAHEKGHSINISTITVIGYLNNKIPLDILISKLKSDVNCINASSIEIEESNNDDKTGNDTCSSFDNYIGSSLPPFTIKLSNKHIKTISKRGKIRKTFFNQVTINYQDISKKSIKIFSNGIIHITGITCFIEAEKLMINMVDTLSHFVNDIYTLEKIKIGMINSNFSYNYTLNLKLLFNKLNDNNIICRYNPESYPAINIKHNNISIFIFGSGNIVITGSKHIQNVLSTYTFITSFLDDNQQLIICKNEKKYKKQLYIDGYPIRQLISNLY